MEEREEEEEEEEEAVVEAKSESVQERGRESSFSTAVCVCEGAFASDCISSVSACVRCDR